MNLFLFENCRIRKNYLIYKQNNMSIEIHLNELGKEKVIVFWIKNISKICYSRLFQRSLKLIIVF